MNSGMGDVDLCLARCRGRPPRRWPGRRISMPVQPGVTATFAVGPIDCPARRQTVGPHCRPRWRGAPWAARSRPGRTVRHPRAPGLGRGPGPGPRAEPPTARADSGSVTPAGLPQAACAARSSAVGPRLGDVVRRLRRLGRRRRSLTRGLRRNIAVPLLGRGRPCRPRCPAGRRSARSSPRRSSAAGRSPDRDRPCGCSPPRARPARGSSSPRSRWCCRRRTPRP